MEKKIIEIIIDNLRMDKDSLVANIDSKEIWDSLQRVEVVFAIEDEFGITLNEDELAILDTPKKLIDAIIGKVG